MRTIPYGRYFIKITVECPDLLGEVLENDVENTALAVEERVSLLLVELFGAVDVNTVTVTFQPPNAQKRRAPGPAA